MFCTPHHGHHRLIFLRGVTEGFGIMSQRQHIVNHWPSSCTIGQSLRDVRFVVVICRKMNISQVVRRVTFVNTQDSPSYHVVLFPRAA